MSAIGETAVAQSPRPGGLPRAFWVLAAIFALGALGLIVALVSGAEPDFALLTASFLYVMGISQAGVVFCAIMRLVGAQWSKPYHRFAELSTMAFLPLAVVVFLLIHFGAQEHLFYWLNAGEEEHLSPWLNIDWLLIRNLLGLAVFYGISFAYVRKGLRGDLDAGVDRRALERELKVMSPYVIVGFVVCNTLFAWDFGMMLVEHWYSTVFPIYFSFGNVFAGTAALVLFPLVLRGTSDARALFQTAQIRCLGMVVTGFTLIWLYLFWAQFFVIWFGNLPREMEPLWRQMYGHYAPYYWTMMAACFFVPFVAFVFAVVKRSLIAMSMIALGINLGIWLNKYLNVVPAFSPDDTPFDSWLDLILAAGLLAGFLAALVWLGHRLPAYSRWELDLPPEK